MFSIGQGLFKNVHSLYEPEVVVEFESAVEGNLLVRLFNVFIPVPDLFKRGQCHAEVPGLQVSQHQVVIGLIDPVGGWVVGDILVK